MTLQWKNRGHLQINFIRVGVNHLLDEPDEAGLRLMANLARQTLARTIMRKGPRETSITRVSSTAYSTMEKLSKENMGLNCSTTVDQGKQSVFDSNRGKDEGDGARHTNRGSINRRGQG